MIESTEQGSYSAVPGETMLSPLARHLETAGTEQCSLVSPRWCQKACLEDMLYETHSINCKTAAQSWDFNEGKGKSQLL